MLLAHSQRIHWRDLSDLQELGAGGYGSVYRATFNQVQVAVKQVKSADLLAVSAPQQFALFLQEVWAMEFLTHPKVSDLFLSLSLAGVLIHM